MSSGVFVWYDKSATDDRVWCVKRWNSEGMQPTARARHVSFVGDAHTDFMAEGFQNMQPGGPRGIISATEVCTVDEVPCG